MVDQQEPPQKNSVTRQTRTFWDWLQLLLLPIVLLACLVWYTVQQTQVISQLSSQQKETANKISQDQQQAAILANYIGRISDMLLHDKLLHSSPIDDVRVIAQAQTYTALQQLDPERKAVLLRFLMQTKLINNDFRVINLRDADLRGARLHGADLRDTYLLGADLRGADLSGTNLSYASLVFARLTGADLTGSNLQSAEIQGADLTGASLKAANLKDIQGSTDEQLAKAKSLAGTILPDGSKHS